MPAYQQALDHLERYGEYRVEHQGEDDGQSLDDEPASRTTSSGTERTTSKKRAYTEEDFSESMRMIQDVCNEMRRERHERRERRRQTGLERAIQAWPDQNECWNVIKNGFFLYVDEIADRAKKLGHEDLSQFLVEKRQEKRKRISLRRKAEAVERAANVEKAWPDQAHIKAYVDNWSLNGL